MKHILVPVLVALALRIVLLASGWDSPFFAEPVVDAKDFHDKAVAIASGEGLPERPYDRPPLFTYFVALVYAIAGPVMRNVFPLHALMGISTVALTAHIARRLFGARVALIAGVVLAASRLPIVLEVQLLGETLQTFLLTLAAALWVEALATDRRPTARWWLAGSALVLFGAVAGALAVVTRPTSALVVVPSLALIAWMSRRDAPGGTATPDANRAQLIANARAGRPRPVAALLGLAVVAIAVGALAVRNRVVGGEWVAVSYNAGINFFVGNAERHDELMSVRPGLRWERLAQTPRALGTLGAYRLDPWRDGFAAWDRRYYDAAFEDIAANPGGWLARLGRKALQFWSRVEIERNVHVTAFVPPGSFLSFATLPFVVLAPFALGGLALVSWRLVRGSTELPAATWLPVLAILGVWATCVIFFVTSRYRVPAYPAIALLAGWSIHRIASGWRAPRGADTEAAVSARHRALGTLGVVVIAAVLVLLDPGGARRIAPARAKHLEAVVLERSGRVREALVAYREALIEYPDDPDVLAGPMPILISAGQPEAAIPLGERAAAVLPDHPTPLFNLGLAYQQAGRHAEAVRTFERLAGVSPNDARAYYQLGRSLTLAGKPEAAFAPLARAAELAPAMPLPWIERARAFIRLGRVEEARDALMAARRVDPGVERMIAADPELLPLAR